MDNINMGQITGLKMENLNLKVRKWKHKKGEEYILGAKRERATK